MEVKHEAAPPNPAVEGRGGEERSGGSRWEATEGGEGAYAMSEVPNTGIAAPVRQGSESAPASPTPPKSPTWRARFQLWKRRFSDRTIIIVTISAALQVLISVLIEAVIAYKHGKFRERYNLITPSPAISPAKANSSALMVYYGIFSAGQLIYFLLLTMSIINCSFVEYVASVVTSGILLIYSFIQIIQSYEVSKAIHMESTQGTVTLSGLFASYYPLFGTISAIIFLNTFAQAWLSRKIENAFGWRTFRELGADLNTKKRLRLYQVYTVLLKLSVVFFFGFDIQFLLLPSRRESYVADLSGATSSYADRIPTTVHFIIALPITIFTILMAHYAQKKESRILMALTVIILQLESVYLGSKIYDVLHPPAENPSKYVGSKNSILFFEVIAIIFAQLTCYVGIINCLSFGKGLMSLVDRSNREALELDEEDSQPPSSYYNKKSAVHPVDGNF